MQNKAQLFCFTYAGGNAAFFDEIEKDLPGLDLVKFEYAGHGTRHREPFYQNFDELTDDIYPKLKAAYSGGQYALFGYSMGSITLVEILRRILEDDMNPPCEVFVSSHEPHAKSELLDFSEDELDEWVKQRTIKFGGVPEHLITNKVFWRMYLPLYRADYTIIGRYKFDELRLNTKIPATVFYSEEDTPLTDMKRWEMYFKGEIEYHRFDGNHFFILNHHQEMAEIILQRMGVKA